LHSGVSVSPVDVITHDISREANADVVLDTSEIVPVDSTPELHETVIQARPGWRLLDLGELWRYRELLLLLTWRDVAVRYKQTVLGIAWVVLQPLAMMAAFSLFLARVAGIAESVENYPLFVLSGLLAWGFFSSAITNAANSL